MNIEHENTAKNGSFYIDIDGQRLGEMTYVWAGSHQIIIDHTEVSEKLKGQGAGKQLVTAAVNWARQDGLKIIPLCPFAKSLFDKTPEFNDVRA